MYTRPMVNILFQTRCAEPQRSAALHDNMLRMVRWAEGKVTDCGFAEHHVSGDGFLSTPLQAAAMAVASGDRLKVNNCAILAPLYNPLFLAEQIAFLDLTSGGRVRTVLALGYREAEYQVAGKDWDTRGASLDQNIEQLLALLRGETVMFNGTESYLHHLPSSPLEKILAVGGNSKVAARRAARFDLPFWPALDAPEIQEAYANACQKCGVENRYIYSRFSGFVLLADDPDAAWKEWGAYLLYDAMAYQAIATTDRRTANDCTAEDIEALRQSGAYRIMTPEQGLELFEQNQAITLNPQAGGLPPEPSWRCLELFEQQMLPHVSLDYRSFRDLPH